MTTEYKPALILIDLQDGFDDPYWGPRNNPQAEPNAKRLLDAWREAGLPVFHVQHLSREMQSPLHPSKASSAIKKLVAPRDGEPVVTKDVNSAFIGTDLEKRLRDSNITDVVLAGITTDHCVSTSTRMASNLDFSTVIVHDATFTHDRVAPDGRVWKADDVHSCALASLHGEFANALSTDEVIQSISKPVSAN